MTCQGNFVIELQVSEGMDYRVDQERMEANAAEEDTN